MKKKMALILPVSKFSSYYILIHSVLSHLEKLFSLDIFSEREANTISSKNYSIVYAFKCTDANIAHLSIASDLCKTPFIYETDDNFITASSTEDGIVHACDASIAKTLKIIFSTASAVLVYSHQSCEDIGRYNSNVAVMPVYQSLYSNEPPLPEQQKRVIGFMGSGLKDVNFSWVLPALHKIHSIHPDVHFEFLGFVPNGAKELPNLLLNDSYIKYEQFIKLFLQKNWTIGLAPLADIPFNINKTNNKYREYAAAGYPGVYSSVAPYADSVIHGKSGIIARNTTQDWISAIDLLLTDEHLRRTIINNAWNHMNREYSYEKFCKMKLRFLTSVAENGSKSNISANIHLIKKENTQCKQPL